MKDDSLWLETDYFEKFKCKGGACRNSCCENWQIAVGMKEYFDLIGRECSPELHHRLECAFRTPDEPSPQRFRLIAPNWMGRCPMHGADGLCMLHGECGEDALPEICRVYPRSLKSEGGMNQACCSGSCEAVIETLMEEDQLSLRFVRRELHAELNENTNHVLLEMAPDCMRILQNREHPLNERIARICARISAREMQPQENKQEKALGELLDCIQNMQNNFLSIQIYGADCLTRYAGAEFCTYRRDANLFEARFEKWQNWFENVLANHLLYAGFPCVDARLQPDDAVYGLCMIYALMRVICIGYCAQHEGKEAVADALSGIFRLIEHSPFYYNARLTISNPAALLTL